MASEIRVNKIANRAGLSTVEYTDTGIIVSGIVTCTEISGLNALNIAGVSTFASPLDINGDIDVDGHTNLDNLSVAGVSTFTGTINGNISGTTAVFDDFLNVGSNIKLGNAGVITATSYRGDGSQLTGIVAGLSTISGVVNVANDLDVDGHTNLDNVNVTGVSTFAETIKFPDAVSGINSTNAPVLKFGNSDDLIIGHDGSNSRIRAAGAGSLILSNPNGIRFQNSSTNHPLLVAIPNGSVSLWNANSKKLETDTKGIVVGTGVTIETNGQATYTGIVTATSFSGDGSSLSNLPAGAPVGGASTNTVFFENDKAVAVNYQVTSTKNAMSAGPIAINAGIAVTVPSGCSWTIV